MGEEVGGVLGLDFLEADEGRVEGLVEGSEGGEDLRVGGGGLVAFEGVALEPVGVVAEDAHFGVPK